MGKVIAKKIRGMNWWAKVGLVTTLTLLVSVFMYQGWYKPKDAPAATVTYYMNIDTTTNLTADGTCNVTGLTPYTSTGIGKTTTVTTEAGTGYRYYPATTGGSSVTALNVYTPVYTANAVDISGISASAALRGLAATDTVKLDLYDYDPAGAANNGTLVASSTAKTLTGGTTTTQYTWTAANFTINGTGRVAQGHRLQFRFTWYSATTGTPRVYFGLTGALTSTNFTVTETAVAGSNTTTLGTGVNATTTTVCPNTTGQKLGGFSFATSTGTDSVTGLTVTTTGQAGIASLQIWNEAGTTQYFSTVNNPGSDTWTFSGGTAIPVTITAANYKVVATYDPYASAPAGNTATTGYVSAYTCTNTKAGADTAEATVTLNHTASTAATWGTNSGGASVTLNWTNGSGGNVLIVRYTGITDTTMPTDGTTYTVSSAFGTGGTVVYEGTGTTTTDTPAAGTYYYRIFAHDSCTNYAATAPFSGALTVTASCTRSAPTVSFGTPATIIPGGNKAYTLTITNNDTAACSNSTFTLARGSETGNTASFVLPSVLGSTTTGALAPQGTYNTTFTVTAQAGATIGHTLTSPVTATDSTNHASQQGSGNVTTTIGYPSSPLMHNSANTSTTYGTWGTTFTCTTCHVDSPATTTNVKKVAQLVATPNGQRRVVFSRMTATSNSTAGIFGNDQRTYALTASTNVCEVCHHKTKYHQYSSVKVTDTSHYANDKSDCTKACHPHGTGFKGMGHDVPFYATSAGHTCASGIGCHANANSAAPYPTSGAPDCRACHKKADPTVSTNGCGSCHGAANGTGEPNGTVYPDIAGGHATHTAAPVFSTCITCHDVGGTGGNANHGPGNRGTNPAVVNLAANLSWNSTNKNCNNTYCHSNGTGGTANGGDTRSIVANSSPAWYTGTATCTTCHGKPPAYANYTGNTPVAGSKANAHQGATHSTKTCDFCHYSVSTTDGGATYTTYSSHNNGKYSIKTSFGYVYNAKLGGTCATPGCHGSIPWGGKLGCINCHNAPINSPVAQGLNAAVTQRRNIVGEFNNTWSHKRASAGAVTDEDCCVCHMEGNASTHKPEPGIHGNGYINLRDPDTGLNIKGVTFSGTPGSYTSTATDAAPVRFSRNLNSSSIEPDVAAIQINQCLKCHDTDGAISTSAQVTGGSALKPFATTVASTGTYYLNNIAAANTAGSVADVKSSFNSTNASYHPVTAKNNNGFIGNTRLKAPWTNLSPDKTGGGTTTYGFLISCWDCHAAAGTASSVTLTSTVTAHGGASTIRADWYVSATTTVPNLCTYCHIDTYFSGGTNHGTGSSWGSGGSSGKYTLPNCSVCHGSTNNSRPWRGVDAHGFNQWAQLRTETVTPANSLKSGPTTSTGHRPYAFIRTNNLAHVNPNTVPAGDGTWTPVGNKPGCVRGAPTSCGNSHGTFTPGGSF